MNKDTRIESTKSFTPPQSGDEMISIIYGRVRLLRPSGGASFWCLTWDNKRISLNPNRMKRVTPESG